MKIWILTMWLWGQFTPLHIGVYDTGAKCEAEAPKHTKQGYSFGHCAVTTVQ